MTSTHHDYDIIDARSGRVVYAQCFGHSNSNSDWDDFEVVDPRSGKQVEPQPFAANPNSDWDDFEVVDPRSGKKVEPQPFAHYEPQAMTLEAEPSEMFCNPPVVECAAPPVAPDEQAAPSPPGIKRLPMLMQELALLQTRGWPVRLAKHRTTARAAAIFFGRNGRSYLIDVNDDGVPIVAYKEGGVALELPVDVAINSGTELLTLLSHMDQCCFTTEA